MFCENCGAQIPDGSKFCTSCGASVGNANTSLFENAIKVDAPDPVAPIASPAGEAFGETSPVEETPVVTPADTFPGIEPVPSSADNNPFQNSAYQANTYSEASSAYQNTYSTVNAGSYQAPPVQPAPYAPADAVKNETPALVLGIFSIVIAVLGCIFFGVIGGAIAIALGIWGIVLSISVRKSTFNQKGTGAFVCSIIGIVLGALFSLGCSLCTCGTGCYGCVGTCSALSGTAKGAYNIYQDVNDIYNGGSGMYDNLQDLEESLEGLEDILNSLGD
ncbi:MAG: zinc-ribbon domain-containing protein [Lachnospiraceae bacterium]|nr:zinc-ribbon domain-containing protein [Lachnospiraceae bacterium]